MEKNWRDWIVDLAEKITSEISSSDEPLDGDETDRLGRLFTLELDRYQGNITDEEYEERIGEIMKGGI